MIIAFRRTTNFSEAQLFQEYSEDEMNLTYSEEEQEIVFTDTAKQDHDDARDDKASQDSHRPTRTKTKKGVTFQPHTEARLIEKHDEHSNEIRKDLWYNAEDFRKIRGYTRTTLCLVNTKTVIPANFEDRFCTRGLEGKTRQALKYRAKLRCAVWSAVFDEQDIQVAERIKDHMAIAEASSSASQAAVQDARDAALQDEKDARDFLSEEVISSLTSAMPLSILKPIDLCRWTLW